ncbi:MAG: O-antigen ligase family protein [Acidobacteria bacterium]|nr:O-antigen ligase family protein [Acidobacteriota bacterium]
MVYSRTSDQIAIHLGGYFAVVRIISISALVLTALSGGIRRALSARPAIFLTAFAFWLLLATPFSIWKGGSVNMLVNVWFKSYIFYVTIAGLLITTNQCRKAMYAIAWGAMLVAALSFFIAPETIERLQFGQTGTLGNPNDLAFFLNISIPACVLMLASRGSSRFLKAAGGAGALLLLLLSFRTGSRGGLIVMAVLLAMLFFRCPRKFKPLMAGAALLSVLIAVALAPADVLDRYRLLFADSPAGGRNALSMEEQRAVASSESRMSLLLTSMRYTAEHPLFGVGPGMFGVAAADDPKIKSLGLGWMQPHNTYTQISSEAGLPALLFYLLAMAFCLRTNFAIYRRLRGQQEFADIANCAYVLFASLVVFTVNGFFMGIAYSYYFPTLAGLTVALHQAALAEVRTAQTGKP